MAVVADKDKNIMRKTHNEGRKISLLKDEIG